MSSVGATLVVARVVGYGRARTSHRPYEGPFPEDVDNLYSIRNRRNVSFTPIGGRNELRPHI